MAQYYAHTFDGPLSEDARRWIQESVEQAYQTESVTFDGDACIEVRLHENIGEEEFTRLITRLGFVSRNMTQRVLFEHHPGRDVLPDPMEALTARGDLTRVAKGMFLLQGEFLQLHRFFNDYWREWAMEAGAIEQDNPALWPVDLYRKIDYFSEFPQQVILATTVEPGSAARETFARRYHKENAYSTVPVRQGFEDSRFGLQSAVCDICYYSLQGKRDFRDTLFTVYNKVFRNESSESDSLDRLTSFSVRDVMFVGSESYVRDWQRRALERAQEFLEWLDLECRIASANDPFFAGTAMTKAVYQNASELKHELLVKLPFSQQEIAVGSVNLHQDFFGRAFDIRQAGGGPVWSGCIGIGFERLVYALYAQFGMNLSAWPEPVVKCVWGDDE